jgi:hypothetical protein
MAGGVAHLPPEPGQGGHRKIGEAGPGDREGRLRDPLSGDLRRSYVFRREQGSALSSPEGPVWGSPPQVPGQGDGVTPFRAGLV